MTVRARSLPQGWYPASAAECKREIEEFLSGFSPPAGRWRGGVAPHAGWGFSGRAAAKTVATLANGARPDRVVVYGGHLPPGNAAITYTDQAWETPFGHVPLDTSLTQALVDQGEARAASRNFADNTVEVQLPLVAHFFPEVPIIAVHSPASQAATALGRALTGLLEAQGLSAVYLGSADLTHYGPNYGFAPQGIGLEAVEWVKNENDRVLIDKAVSMDSDGLLSEAHARHNTCSAGPIVSVIASVAEQGAQKGTLLEYYTSYDLMPNASFVGYAAIVY